MRQAYNSCRNRHCPKCQGLARAQWLAERQAELLPVPYFHVVFTVPAQIAEIAFQNQAAVYAILFKAASEALRCGRRSRHLGAEIGVVAVLHTWGQNLHHHPHVHCVVPAAAGARPATVTGPALARLQAGLLPAGARAVTPVQAAIPGAPAGRLRRRPASLLQRSRWTGRPCHLLRPTGWTERIEWVVYAKAPLGGPEKVLAYLGRYTHRVAIANSRLVSLDQGKVSFRWKDYRHHDKPKLMTLSADEFIRRFLLHVLPDGFHRIRHYGLLANGHRVAKLAQCRLLLAAPTPPPDPTGDYRQRYRCFTGRSLDICPGCGGTMAPLGPLPRKAPTWPDTS